MVLIKENTTLDKRQVLRKKMRAARKALSVTQQSQASDQLLEHLLTLPELTQAQSVALYLSSDGEIDPQSVIDYCWSQGKDVYLPVLDPDKENQLLFVHYTTSTLMCHNKYKILEPKMPFARSIAAQDLDLVLLPLVAFDHTGNRMGMGGGYYDRSFAFTSTGPSAAHPILIGLAHELQRVDQLDVASWDIPLCAIVSDCKVYAS